MLHDAPSTLLTPTHLVPLGEDGHEEWERYADFYPELLFADDDNYVLLVNYESDYLELTYVCVIGRTACGGMPYRPTAIPELGEARLVAYQNFLRCTGPAPGTLSRRAQKLSSGISSFIERTIFPLQKEMLRAVIVTGGASDMDSIWQAANDALPLSKTGGLRRWMTQPSCLSLGAAAEIRKELIGIDQRDCYCELPAPWKDGPLWNDTWRLENGFPLADEWLCITDLDKVAVSLLQ